jgi:predicted nucleotidyltransferase
MDPLQAARRFVKSNFDDCVVALLAGSAARHEQTKTSDLDILIITNAANVSYKEFFFEYDWPIEVFVHSEETVLNRMRINADQRKCFTANLLKEGIVLQGDSHAAERLKNIANDFLQRGPNEFTQDEDVHAQYCITEALDDLIGSDTYEEQVFIVNELLPKVINYQLVKEKQWRAGGKLFPRAIQMLGSEFASQLRDCLHEFYKGNSKEELIQFVIKILNIHGRLDFRGYVRRISS